jgi:NADPH2:quinone reductase
MRLIVLEKPGDSTNFKLIERSPPEPQRGEIRLRVHSSGLNRADLLQRRGHYPAPPGYPQDILGLEVAGVVDAVGPDASGWNIGDAAMAVIGGGGYAESVVLHAREAMRVPKTVTAAIAAAIPEAFLTAYDALFNQAHLKAGETVLIHAVASGVGTAALQLALHAGARVIGTSRSAGKLEKAKALGLTDAVISEGDWPKEVARRAPGIDVVIDLVGGPMAKHSPQLLRDRGRHIQVGLTAGATTELDLGALLRKRASMIGTVLRSRPFDEKLELARTFDRLMIAAFERGQLRPVIDTTFEPDAIASAHERLETNDSFGKILIDWT